MPCTGITSGEFYATWEHSPLADFHQNGVRAHSEPWVAEATKITLNDEARAAVLSDDGSLLAAGIGHEIHVYSMATSQLLHTFRGHAGHKIEDLEFQPGGRKLAAGATRSLPQKRESMVRVWDLDAPAQPLDHLDHATQRGVAAASSILMQHWSADDLASAKLQTEIAEIIAGGQVAVDVRNRRVVLGELFGFESRAFSPDGRSLLYRPDRNNVAVLDVDTLVERFRLSDHTDAVMWAEISPTNKVVATSSWDKTVRIWSMNSGELIRVLEGAMIQSWSGAWSSDGELIAAGAGDQRVRIWRVETGELLHTLTGFSQWIRSLAFSPDSLYLAGGAAGGTLRVLDVTSGAIEHSWQINLKGDHGATAFLEVNGVRYTSRGDLFFCSTDGHIFGYSASRNWKWDCEEAVPCGRFTTSMDGSKLIAPLGSTLGINLP
ncbi:quinon protein alcohol dehydrogenase-like superfamily [Mycena capillaripes]|nr:quinon protein alcohol dehydrogenase-like superfamily [Mycena capillaripes]